MSPSSSSAASEGGARSFGNKHVLSAGLALVISVLIAVLRPQQRPLDAAIQCLFSASNLLMPDLLFTRQRHHHTVAQCKHMNPGSGAFEGFRRRC